MALTLRLVAMKKLLNRFKLPIFGLMASATLGGCSSLLNPAGESTFSCPGMPQGVTCKSPAAVYRSTNGSLPIADSDLPMGEKTGGAPEVGAIVLPGITSGSLRSPDEIANSPAPVRAPAQIMRVWIAPWVDKNDNLNYPGVIYTEITPRRWAVGIPEASGGGMVVPHLASPDQARQPNGPRPPENPRQSGGRSGDMVGGGSYSTMPVGAQDGGASATSGGVSGNGSAGITGTGFQNGVLNGTPLPSVQGMRMP